MKKEDILHSFGCKQQRWQLCLACKARVCACHGTDRGQCPECLRGLLTNYYALPGSSRYRACGYKGCKSHAVASTPRVGYACLEHAIARGGFRLPATMPDPAPGTMTDYTLIVLRTLGIEELIT